MSHLIKFLSTTKDFRSRLKKLWTNAMKSSGYSLRNLLCKYWTWDLSENTKSLKTKTLIKFLTTLHPLNTTMMYGIDNYNMKFIPKYLPKVSRRSLRRRKTFIISSRAIASWTKIITWGFISMNSALICLSKGTNRQFTIECWWTP